MLASQLAVSMSRHRGQLSRLGPHTHTHTVSSIAQFSFIHHTRKRNDPLAPLVAKASTAKLKELNKQVCYCELLC